MKSSGLFRADLVFGNASPPIFLKQPCTPSPSHPSNPCLTGREGSRDNLAMNFVYAAAVWIGMGVLLGLGLLLAVAGKPWLLIAGVLAFIIAVGKIGCATH